MIITSKAMMKKTMMPPNAAIFLANDPCVFMMILRQLVIPRGQIIASWAQLAVPPDLSRQVQSDRLSPFTGSNDKL